MYESLTQGIAYERRHDLIEEAEAARARARARHAHGTRRHVGRAQRRSVAGVATR